MIPPYVPTPTFGYGETPPPRPSPWTSEVPGYYYVSATGTDTGRPYGTPSAPRQTIPQGLGPGRRIELASGATYGLGSGGNINFTGAGDGDPWVATVSGPIWFVGDPSNRPVLTTLDGFLRGSYLYLYGLSFSTVTLIVGIGGAPGFAADHIFIGNCIFTGTGLETSNRSAISMTGYNSTNFVDQVVVQGNVMSNWGDLDAGTDVDACGFVAETWCSNVWFLENTVHSCSGTGGRVGGAYANTQSPYNTDFIYACDNEIYNCRQAGIAVKLANNVIFAENQIHDILTGPGGDGCGFVGLYSPLNFWMINNVIFNCNYGIYLASTYDTVKNSSISGDLPGIYYVYAVGNLIYDCFGSSPTVTPFSEAGIRMYGGTFRYMVNNTIYGCQSGIIANGFANGTGGGFFISNNIVDYVTDADGQHLWFVNELTNSTVDNCLFYQPAGTARFIWGSPPSKTLAQFQSASGLGQNCQEADPEFTNVAARILTLTASSPAIDAGIVDPVYAQYASDFGLALNVDLVGTSRPLGGVWDEGAYEFDNSSSSPPVITSPSTVSGTLNSSFSYQITTSGGTPDNFGAIGLPAGVSLNPLSGLISGTPTTFGVFDVDIFAANSDGQDAIVLRITIENSGLTSFIQTQSQMFILTESGSKIGKPS